MAYFITGTRNNNKLSCLFEENENKQAFSFYKRLQDNGFSVVWRHFNKLSISEWLKQYDLPIYSPEDTKDEEAHEE